ncbi:MAG TPA: endonuclease domain-containing protein [Candidatus Binatia bacterium]
MRELVEPSSTTLRERARRLRRDQTEAERRLWTRLRARQLCGVKFRRQYPIGSFIVDFCCFEHRLVIELDGGQHARQTAADQRRSAVLVSFGYRVLRFWDNEVMEDIDAVLQQIMQAVDDSKPALDPSPGPSPTGRGSDKENATKQGRSRQGQI